MSYVLSDKRLADLETLLHCIFLVTMDIMWLFEEEEIDITRDITSKSLGVADTESFHESGALLHYTGEATFTWENGNVMKTDC